MADQTEKVAEFIELTEPSARTAEVCTRAAVHYEAGRTVAVYVPDSGDAAELDKLMKADSAELKTFIEGEAEKYKDILG